MKSIAKGASRFAVLVAIAMNSCSTAEGVVGKAGEILSGNSTEANGASVYSLNCVRCHNGRPADSFSDREWDVIIPHMRERAHLTGPETKAVLRFLQISNLPETLEDATKRPPSADLPATDPESGPKGKSPATTAKKSAPAIRKVKPELGATLVARYQCAGCHKVGGTGGKMGPPLDGVVGRRGRAFVWKKIQNPRFNNPASAMPKFPFSAEQVTAMVDYLQTLR